MYLYSFNNKKQSALQRHQKQAPNEDTRTNKNRWVLNCFFKGCHKVKGAKKGWWAVPQFWCGNVGNAQSPHLFPDKYVESQEDLHLQA